VQLDAEHYERIVAQLRKNVTLPFLKRVGQFLSLANQQNCMSTALERSNSSELA
jgi:hypothetical protein